ncbi:MAG: CvpA family protein [Candidatus Margulisiibacteriota bacterium]|jgi:uncharacterized membrane protein required for colicin V production
MIDTIIALSLLVFMFLGFRSGLARTAGSVVMVFIAIYLGNLSLDKLVGIVPAVSQTGSLVSILIFIFVWLVAFVILDLVLGLLLKRVIQITVLGPLDKVGGLIVGIFRGLLIVGILLQVSLAFPLPSNYKLAALNSITAKFSMATFQWAFPLAKKWAPYIKVEMKDGTLEHINIKENINKTVTKEIEAIKSLKLNVSSEAIKDAGEKIEQLLNDQKIIPLKVTAEASRKKRHIK